VWVAFFYALKEVKQMKKIKDTLKVRGFFRVQVTEDGQVVGDSGWRENQVVNDGFNDYLVKSLGAIAGSKQITHMALGTGAAPGASATSLPGEVAAAGGGTGRSAITAATSSTSKTVRFTATFNSTQSFVSANHNISNVGLFHQSATGTIFAGNVYASSTVATNQNVNATYDIIFA
jgi:hypothetical protein